MKKLILFALILSSLPGFTQVQTYNRSKGLILTVGDSTLVDNATGTTANGIYAGANGLRFESNGTIYSLSKFLNPYTFSGLLVNTGGTISLNTITIAAGGTGATDASTARSNLGVTIGTNVQAYDATLQSISSTGTVADRTLYTTGIDAWAETPLTSFSRSLLDDTNQAGWRTTLGLTPGTDVQAFDTELSAIAGTSSAANKGIYYTGSGTATTYDLTAFGRALSGVGSYTAGHLLFGAGTSAPGAESALFWDSSNDRLGISTTSPSLRVHAVSTTGSDIFYADANGQSFAGYRLRAGASGQEWAFRGGNTSMSLTDVTAGVDRVTINSTGLGVGITPTQRLHVSGNGIITGSLTAASLIGPLTGNATTATTLQTPRAIYGNNFDGSAALTQIIASTYGGTGNGFTKFSGAATSEKTYTLPNANATILTDNAAVTVAQGGTGRATSTTAYGLIAAGTTATGAHQTLAAGATTEILVGGGASALPVWATATGTGAPVRANTPTLTNPVISGGSITGLSSPSNSSDAATKGYVDGLIVTTASGTYTPTLTNGTNVAASFSNVCTYTRVGDNVTVSGVISVDPTSGATNYTELGISLPPIASSNFTNGTQAAGVAVGLVGSSTQAAKITSDSTNDRVTFEFFATNVSTAGFSFTFTYQVL
jgi:hypothetical protein